MEIPTVIFNPRRLQMLIACLVLMTGATAIIAQDAARSAPELFRQGDYEAAAERWGLAAKAGSAEAMFRLAQMNDLGLGMPRDPDRALKGYIAAGMKGHTAAQFNAAAMFDTGSDSARNPQRAAFWYALAAVDGHTRSAYNLGLLFAHGDGVPQNLDLARHWIDRAAPTLDVAAQERAMLGPDEPQARRMTAPRILGANVVRKRSGWRVALVWAPPPGPPGTRYLVELIARPSKSGAGGRSVAMRRTEASAAIFEISRKPAGLAWRVSRIADDGSVYASSRWADVASRAGRGARPLPYPAERVTIRFGKTDPAGKQFADELSSMLAAGGVWSHVEGTAPATVPEQSAVTYRFAQDADLASAVAASLPVFGAADARRSNSTGTAPGEIIVTLVGGPVATEASR